jgi:putative IMPACT (imprinted ancient) family translation regulator
MNAVTASGLDHCVVLVTRYFGGTQLGTGGLIRAYGGAAQLALELAATEATEVRPKVDAVVNGTPGDLGKIFLALDEFAAQKIDEEYSDDGSVHIQILCDEGVVEMLKQRLANTTSGRTEFKYWAR